jgi:hypothetical protein
MSMSVFTHKGSLWSDSRQLDVSAYSEMSAATGFAAGQCRRLPTIRFSGFDSHASMPLRPHFVAAG